MSMNRIISEDLQNIIQKDIPFGEIRNSTILITGATGLIGSMLVKALLFLNKEKGLGITVIALIRDKSKADCIFGDFLPDSSLKYIFSDLLNDEIRINGSIDYIIHAASVTKSKTMINKPVETILTAVMGTNKILNLAKEKSVKSFVYISSMEMYGVFVKSEGFIREKDLGFIDPLAVRSNYPESKRMCENLCISYLLEYNIPVRIARLAQTFGAGILPNENRVFAQFARSVINQQDIVLHTNGLSEGNYCYISEAVEGILLLLLKGENGEAYNIVNENCHTTIAEMAQMAANEIAGGSIKVVFDIPTENIYGYASETHMKLSSSKIRNLGWKPEIDLRKAYQRLIDFLKIEGLGSESKK